VRKLLKNKRAVSPVIATVLLILIVMAGMTLLFGFVGSYATSFQSGEGSRVLESLTIEDYWFTRTTDAGQVDVISIWLYNTGKVDVKLNTFYLNGAQTRAYGSNYINDYTSSPLSSNTLVKVGEHLQIVIPYSIPGSCTVKIASARGSTFEGVLYR
jgi:flagellin-like protein